MNCQNARERITDLLAAGSVEPTKELTGHMESCAGCGTFYAQQAALFRAMDSALSAMANEPMPLSLLPRVRARMAETRTSSTWFYRLLPIAAILVVAYVIAFPLVRHSFRSGSVQVAVIPKRSENGVQSRPPLAGQPEISKVHTATREQRPRHSVRLPAAQRPVQTAEVAVLVSSEESQGLLQLAAAVPRSPQWAQAMVHPAASPSTQMTPIKPVEIANLEVQPLSGGNE
ncbi:MAG TPA: hypothetical protein VFB10_09785 [Candidatus Dormibacteraeota bacterium]|nr:hypothetical protein [Candidatus Dormibacteraeota bacterium]